MRYALLIIGATGAAWLASLVADAVAAAQAAGATGFGG